MICITMSGSEHLRVCIVFLVWGMPKLWSGYVFVVDRTCGYTVLVTYGKWRHWQLGTKWQGWGSPFCCSRVRVWNHTIHCHFKNMSCTKIQLKMIPTRALAPVNSDEFQGCSTSLILLTSPRVQVWWRKHLQLLSRVACRKYYQYWYHACACVVEIQII